MFRNDFLSNFGLIDFIDIYLREQNYKSIIFIDKIARFG